MNKNGIAKQKRGFNIYGIAGYIISDTPCESRGIKYRVILLYGKDKANLAYKILRKS